MPSRSTHWCMQEAIEQYVEREEQQRRMWNDAVASWERYQADGLHLTGQEADEWLAKLEAGEDAEPPIPAAIQVCLDTA